MPQHSVGRKTIQKFQFLQERLLLFFELKIKLDMFLNYHMELHKMIVMNMFKKKVPFLAKA